MKRSYADKYGIKIDAKQFENDPDDVMDSLAEVIENMLDVQLVGTHVGYYGCGCFKGRDDIGNRFELHPNYGAEADEWMEEDYKDFGVLFSVLSKSLQELKEIESRLSKSGIDITLLRRRTFLPGSMEGREILFSLRESDMYKTRF